MSATAPNTAAVPLPQGEDAPSDGRSAERAELLRRVARAGRLKPNLRFGQLVDFVGFLAQAETGRGLPDAEDRQFLEALKQFEANAADPPAAAAA